MSLLPLPAAVLQSPSYEKKDLEQGGSIGDGPNLLEPKDPWTPQAPGIDAGCLKNYQYQLAACYAQALKVTQDERRLLVNACYDDFQGAVDAALEAVAAAERTLDAATVGIYQPANPLILDCPVQHCMASSYQVGDQVLIDFPVRTGSAMAVWDSRRVIGWASDTRNCKQDIFLRYHDYNDQNQNNGYTVSCRGEITPGYFPYYDGYWPGQVAGYNHLEYWLHTNAPKCAALTRVAVIRDGKALTVDVRLRVTSQTVWDGERYIQDGLVTISARDLSKPLEYGQTELQAYKPIAVISPPEGGWGPAMTWAPILTDSWEYPDEVYRPTTLERFFAFSPSALKLGVVSVERTMPLSQWEGAIGLTAEVVLPAIDFDSDPVQLQFSIVVKGDPQSSYSDYQMAAANGFYDHPIIRNLVLGARWNGDTLETYQIRFIRNQEGYSNYDEDGHYATKKYSMVQTLRWECSNDFDLNIHLFSHSYENQTLDIFEGDEFIETVTVSGHTLTDTSTIKAGVIPITEFAFPVLYHSQESSKHSEFTITDDVQTIISYTEDYPLPSLHFVSGDVTLGELDLAFLPEGDPSELDIHQFYTLISNTHNLFIFNIFFVNQHHVTIPCPAIQLNVDMPIGDEVSFFDPVWSINKGDKDSTVLDEDRLPLYGPNKSRLFVNEIEVDVSATPEMLYLCESMLPQTMGQ